MTLADYIRELCFGQLSDLPFLGEGTGIVPAEHLPKVLNAYNGAMEAVYQRFPIDLKTIVVETVDGIYTYPLRAEYAQTSSSLVVNKFIKDLAGSPFTGDVLAIERVYDSNMLALPLNERGIENAWMTPSFDTVSMDHPATGIRFYVQYRAAPKKIDLTATDEQLDYEIRLPLAVRTAAKLHIAATIFGGMGMEGSLSKSAGFYAAYENECARLERDNTLNQSVLEDTNIRPMLGGWV